jgi:bacillithiol biosynthesis deacetylase BshB1
MTKQPAPDPARPRRAARGEGTTPPVRPGCDVLAIGPHPDDVELVIGGTCAALAKAGRRVVAVELTRGESGTLGDARTRERESQRAGRILGLAARENLGLPDAALEFTLPYRRAVAAAVRRWRPEVILAPLPEDAHPDHVVAGRLAESAFFEARLRKIADGEEPWYTRLLFFYPCRTYRHPTLVVDVSDVYAVKLRAMNAHRSQAPSRSFRAAGYNDVFSSVQVRDRFFGGLIGRPYGEGLVATGPLPVTATDQLFFKGCP